MILCKSVFMKVLLYILIFLLCTSCSSTGPDKFPEQTEADGGEFQLKVENTMDSLLSDESLQVCAKESQMLSPAFSLSEQAAGVLKKLIEFSEMVEWTEIEVNEVDIPQSAIYGSTAGSGSFVIPLSESKADIIFLDPEETVTFAAVNSGSDEVNGTFRERILSWFSVNEVSIDRVSIPGIALSQISDLPALIMEKYGSQLLSMSAINDYAITCFEVRSTKDIYEQDGEITFYAEYAVKPKNIDFSDWYAGGGGEPLTGEYDGWLLLSKEIVVTYDADNDVWICKK